MHATCLVYYLFSLIDSSEEMWLYWYFLRQRQVIIQLVEVPVLSQESERHNEKIKIKFQWDPSEIHVPFLGSPGPVPMYRLNPPPSPRPSHRPCVPLTSPADDLKFQSLKIDGCSPSSVIKIVKMKYNRIDIKM